MDVQIKRVYDSPSADDGTRVLIDRLWPRGVSKQSAALDLWLKDAAPSPVLRKAWHSDPDAHEPDRFRAFADAYRDELAQGAASAALDQLVRLARESARVTLLYGARDQQVNHAIVLRDAVLDRAAE